MPRIVRFHETGSADVLKLEDLPLDEPGKGQIRLKVEALGLNRAEIMYRQGQYLEATKLPSRIGYEAAGTVDALGPNTAGFQIGDRVSTIPSFSMHKYGVYGESAIVPITAVAYYPRTLSAVAGAAIWMQYLTAYGALIHYGRLRSDDCVLIPAASSSVGLAAIQITKATGATAIATTRGAGKKDALLKAGADHVIVTDDEDVVDKVMEITAGKGVRIIFDPVAGPHVEVLASAASAGGIIFEYGALSLQPTIFPLFKALSKGLVVRGYTLFEIVRDREILGHAKSYVYEGLDSGRFQPIIARTFPLDAIAEAHRYMESNAHIGKIVVTV
ncbi:MAG: zinc-dependent alcohol dehydrogenase family protein [Hyphomicrobiales bacterium]|nr:zinc-dependent alcohol dehydrogenase family protein [Hyphomicrobiales bacterium]